MKWKSLERFKHTVVMVETEVMVRKEHNRVVKVEAAVVRKRYHSKLLS